MKVKNEAHVSVIHRPNAPEVQVAFLSESAADLDCLTGLLAGGRVAYVDVKVTKTGLQLTLSPRAELKRVRLAVAGVR